MKFTECVLCANRGDALACRGCYLLRRLNGEWGGSNYRPIDGTNESTAQACPPEGGGEAGNKHLKVLKEYRDWHRGIGGYAWNEIPEKNKEFPYSPKDLGEAIDEAIRALSNVAEGE